MSPFRNRRWVLTLSLVSVLAGAATLVWFYRPAKPLDGRPPISKEAKKAVTPKPRIVGEIRRLEVGKPIEAELSALEGHAYELSLQAGQYAYVIANQKGIDVAVRLIGPDGRLIVRVDSPNGSQGPEPVHEVSESGGMYRIEVVCEDPSAAKGRYEIRIEELRKANETDRKRLFAERRFNEGEDLRRKKTDEAEKQALARYREALSVWRELGDHKKESESLFRIGWVSIDVNDLAGALAALQEALPLSRRLTDRAQEAMVLNFIGQARLQLGQLEPARKSAEDALSIARDLKSPSLEATALNVIANSYFSAGEMQKAYDGFQQALTAARTTTDPNNEATALFGIGDIQVDQGKLDTALDALEQARATFNALGNHRLEVNTLRRIADVYQRLGDLPRARAKLEEAQRSLQGVGDAQVEGVVLNSLGTVRLLQGETEAAGQAYREALTRFTYLHDAYNQAFSLLNLGRYFHAKHDPREALSYHEKAAGLFRSQRSVPGEVATTFGSARALHDLGDFKAADEKLQWVLEHIELLRSASPTEEQRVTYLATKQHYYDLHVNVLMYLAEQFPAGGFAERAFEMNERRHARGLLDLLLQSESSFRKENDPTLLAEERSLHQALNAVNDALLGGATGSPEKTSELEKRQRDLLARLDRVRSEITERNPRYADFMRREPLKFEDVQSKVLDTGTVMLVYSLGEERSFVWVISKSGAPTWKTLAPRAQIESLAREAYRAWSQRLAARSVRDSLAGQVSDMLIRPIADQLGRQRLLVIADGALQYLPFAALPDPRARVKAGEPPPPLVLNHEIISLPSASALLMLRRELHDRDLAPRRIAVIADPVFGPDDPRVTAKPAAAGPGTKGGGDLARAAQDVGLKGLARLPFTEQEAEAIRSLVVEEQRFEALGFDANRATVTGGKLKRYRVLHFATHGVLDSQHPELSGLVLSLVDAAGNPQPDGFLRSYEISDLDLRAELAVLSACQTGLGKEIRGEGLVGLTRSFMHAGVPRIVVSLWNVGDRSTSELMRRFYKGLFKHNLAPSAALRCAQLSMLKQQDLSDPFQWAGFVFQGEWNLNTPPEGGIEATPGAAPPVKSDNSLPPPDFGPPAGCPDL